MDPNPSALARTGTLTIAGATYTLTQDGAACTFALTPATASFAPAGGNGTFDVATPLDCSWTATSGDPAWLQVSSGTPGDGPGTVAFAAGVNAVASSRSATVTVGDGSSSATFSVAQGAAGCTFVLSASAGAIDAAGGVGSFDVVAGNDWVATSSQPWLAITFGGDRVAILARGGYRVVASTGRPQEAAYLESLGAAEIVERGTLSSPGKPLQKERFAAVIDSVGSHTLANACAQVRHGGAVAACGLAGGMDFPATVAPFILRGVTLYGIDSNLAPRQRRVEAWSRLATDLDPALLESMTRQIGLSEALAAAEELLAGRVRGRLVVDVRS